MPAVKTRQPASLVRGTARLICGDNCRAMIQMEEESVDLVVTSPPYDNLRTYDGHTWDFYGAAWNLKRLLKPGGVIVWVVADATVNGSETGSNMLQALHFRNLGLNLHDTMIWNKSHVLPSPMGSTRYSSSTEYMYVISKGKPKTWNPLTVATKGAGSVWHGSGLRGSGGDRDLKAKAGRIVGDTKPLTNLWTISIGERNPMNHPAVFPRKLAEQHIMSWSNPGDLVLDPFAGSGTTLVAAIDLGRNAVGIELNPRYIEGIRFRIKCQ